MQKLLPMEAAFMHKPLLSAATLLLLLGCSPARWENPVTGTARLEPDLAQCAQAARDEVASYGPGALVGWPVVPGSRRVELFEDPTFRAAWEWSRETELRDFCMHLKGYQVVPGSVAANPG
jgi:hypothetical protein